LVTRGQRGTTLIHTSEQTTGKTNVGGKSTGVSKEIARACESSELMQTIASLNLP